MSMIARLPSPTGTLGAVKHSRTQVRADAERAQEIRLQTLRRELVRDDTIGHFRPRRESLLYVNKKWDDTPLQQRALAWLRDHVHPGIPRAYYHVLLGHDIHLTASAELFVVHHHTTEPDPFTGSIGWTENVGRVSQGKVTTAFRDFMSLMLVTDATTMGDYKYHEVQRHQRHRRSQHRHGPGHDHRNRSGGRQPDEPHRTDLSERGDHHGRHLRDVAGAWDLQRLHLGDPHGSQPD